MPCTRPLRRDGSQDEGDRRGRFLALDNTLLLYTATWPTAATGRDDYPVVLAGKAGGTLEDGPASGVREAVPPVSNLYVEILNRFGVPVKTFGDSHSSRYAGSLDGRLPGLV